METMTPEAFQAAWPTRIPLDIHVLDVVVASDLAVHWLQFAPAEVASLAELKLVAAARCAHLHGGSTQDWWVTGDWALGRPFVCAALPRDAAEPIAHLARDARVPARWHTAWSAATSAGWWPTDTWSALRTPGCVTLWHCRAGWVDSLITWPVQPRASAADVSAQCVARLRIESLRDAQLEPGTLHWFDAGTPGVSTDLPGGVVRVDVEPIVAVDVAVDEAQTAFALYERTRLAA